MKSVVSVKAVSVFDQAGLKPSDSQKQLVESIQKEYSKLLDTITTLCPPNKYRADCIYEIIQSIKHMAKSVCNTH